jgi:hypothetical protein
MRATIKGTRATCVVRLAAPAVSARRDARGDLDARATLHQRKRKKSISVP